MVLVQVVQNVGMTIRVLPITGIPLPLVSYGGSSLLTTLLALGLVQSVRIHRSERGGGDAGHPAQPAHRYHCSEMTDATEVTGGGDTATVWPALERLLPQVQKPARYIGGEAGSCAKEPDPTLVSWLVRLPRHL